MLNKFKKNQRAQVSEIMVWIIATVIILTILVVFIYSSSLLAQKTKTIKAKNLEVDFGGKESLLDTKTEIVYSISSESEKEIIDNWRDEYE